ncbi:MAG: hypothetical protein ABF322_08090 [Lentimonas sp.]
MKHGFPAELLDPLAEASEGSGAGNIKGSYGALGSDPSDANWTTPGFETSYLTAQLVNPAQTAAYATALDWRVVYGGRLSWTVAEAPNGGGALAYRYGGSALVVLFDGYDEEVILEMITDIDDNGGIQHPFWKGAN